MVEKEVRVRRANMLQPKGNKVNVVERLLRQQGFILEKDAELCSDILKCSFFYLEDPEGEPFTVAYDNQGRAWRAEGMIRLPDPFQQFEQVDNGSNDRSTPLRQIIDEWYGHRVEVNPCPTIKNAFLEIGSQTFVWDELGVMWEIKGKIRFPPPTIRLKLNVRV